VARSAPVLAVPLVGLVPDHPPEAVQLVALVEDQFSIAEPPRTTVLGVALKLAVGLTAAASTVIAKAGNAAEARPSLTLITMPAYVPTFAAAGAPLSRPLAVLKLAQEGLLTMENVRMLPDGSVAVGVNEYAVPAVTLVPGEPEIVGADEAAVTVIANAGSEALATPSVTLITIPE